MKQLYIIGILVAVLLLLLLGLAKLGQAPTVDTVRDEDTSTNEVGTTTDDTGAAQDMTTLNTEPMQTDTTQPVADVSAENTVVVMRTNRGDITLELFTEDMPITTGNFLTLAQSDFTTG